MLFHEAAEAGGAEASLRWAENLLERILRDGVVHIFDRRCEQATVSPLFHPQSVAGASHNHPTICEKEANQLPSGDLHAYPPACVSAGSFVPT